MPYMRKIRISWRTFESSRVFDPRKPRGFGWCHEVGYRKAGCWLVLVELELDFDIVGLARKTVGERRDLRYFLRRAHH